LRTSQDLAALDGSRSYELMEQVESKCFVGCQVNGFPIM